MFTYCSKMRLKFAASYKNRTKHWYLVDTILLQFFCSLFTILQSKKLIEVRDYLNNEEGLKVETWEQMPFLINMNAQQRYFQHEPEEEFPQPAPAGVGGRLDTIAEVRSNYSGERSEEELELSGLVRSYREYNRN